MLRGLSQPKRYNFAGASRERYGRNFIRFGEEGFRFLFYCCSAVNLRRPVGVKRFVCKRFVCKRFFVCRRMHKAQSRMDGFVSSSHSYFIPNRFSVCSHFENPQIFSWTLTERMGYK